MDPKPCRNFLARQPSSSGPHARLSAALNDMVNASSSACTALSRSRRTSRWFGRTCAAAPRSARAGACTCKA